MNAVTARDAGQAAGLLPGGAEGLIVLLGAAPAILEELRDKRFDNFRIVVYDPDGALADPDPRFRVAAGEDFSFLGDYHREIANGRSFIVRHRPTVDRYPEKCAAFMEQLERHKRLSDMNTATAVQMGRHFLTSYLGNVPAIVANPGVAPLRDLFKGRPAIVASAGPSLDAAGRDLFEAAWGRAIVIAADAAVPNLALRGIVPDIVTGIDPIEENGRFYKGVDAAWRSVALVAHCQYTPAVISRWRGPVFLSGAPGNVVEQWVGPLWDAQARGTIPTWGGSVSHFAVELAIWLGCGPIALIGQDLCFRRTYWAAGIAEALTDAPDVAPPGIEVRTWKGEIVSTSASLQAFGVSLEERIKRGTPPIYQCSDGLAIAGAEGMEFADFVERHCPCWDGKGEPLLVAAALREAAEAAPAREVDKVTLLAELHGVIGILSGKARDARRISRLVRKAINARGGLETAVPAPIMAKLQRLTGRFPHPALNLLAAYAYGLELYLSRADVRQGDGNDGAAQDAAKQLEHANVYYGEIAGAIGELLPHLRKVEEGLHG